MPKFLFFVLVLVSFFARSQNLYYINPVTIPMLLSGSYAELRNNHFHSGIDIKTQGRVDIPVHAVADGFVSRISVSPTGYGNVLYIEHDNGTTSVYGHLNRFRPDIQNYIKNIQYENKSFKVDIPVLPGIFPVTKGEKLALSGNSGSSEGPHLHFELRNTKTGDPLNPLKLGIMVTDNTPPVFTALQIVPLSEGSHVNYSGSKVIFEAEFTDGCYRLKNNPVIPVYGEIGFAVEAYDLTDGSANRCGINSMELTIDDVIYSTFEINRFSFNETGFVNSFIDYAEFITSGRRFQKTWTEPCGKFSNFTFQVNNGIFDPGIDKKHDIRIDIKDSRGNISTIAFSVIGKYREVKTNGNNSAVSFKCGEKNHYQNESFKIDFQENSLYNNIEFQYSEKEPEYGFYSKIHKIHNNKVPLHKSATVMIKTENLDEMLQNKALLVNINPVNGKFTPVGGTIENGWITAEIKAFGDYAVRVDSVPPSVLPLSIVNNNTLTENNRLRFEITDDLSGIGKIEGLIDGNWALFEYDAKNNLITHYFDAERFELNKQHNFKLTVTDNRENISVYEASFYR